MISYTRDTRQYGHPHSYRAPTGGIVRLQVIPRNAALSCGLDVSPARSTRTDAVGLVVAAVAVVAAEDTVLATAPGQVRTQGQVRLQERERGRLGRDRTRADVCSCLDAGVRSGFLQSSIRNHADYTQALPSR